MKSEFEANSVFCFFLQPATSTLQVKRESAEEVTRGVGTAAMEGLELVMCPRKSGLSYKCVIPVAATKGHCITCTWDYLAFWSPESQISLLSHVQNLPTFKVGRAFCQFVQSQVYLSFLTVA